MTRLYLSLILALTVLALAGFVFWRYFYLSVLVLDIIPTEATVTINGTPVVDRTLHLEQGTYEIAVSAPGYRNQSFSHVAKIGGQSTKRIELSALPKPERVVDGPIHSVQPSADRTMVYFVKGDTLYRLNLTEKGSPAEPITPKLPGVRRVDWSPDFSIALLYKQNGEVGIYDFNRYDLLNQSYRALSSLITDTVWDADGSGFYYLVKLDDGTRLLAKSDRGGNDIARYDHVGIPTNQDVELVQGPNNQVVIAGTNPAVPADIVVSDNYTRTIVPLTTTQNAYEPVLSDDKKQLAYLENGELVMATTEGKDRRNTNIRPKSNSYAFGVTKLFALTTNQLSLIDRTTGELTTSDVYAPDDTLTTLFADASEQSIYYVYRGNLFVLNANP